MQDVTQTEAGDSHRAPRSRQRKALLVLPAAAVAVTALVGAAGTSFAGPARHAAATADVKVATVAKYGKILETAAGLALYYDTANKPGKWACTGNCLTAWPPLLVAKGEKAPVGGPGVTGLGTVKSPSGRQVTWEGKPLYTFIKDSKGQVKGNGAFHVWFVAQLKSSTTVTTKSAWA